MEQKALKQKKAAEAFASMRTKAAEKGYMTDKEIEAEIAATRRKMSGDFTVMTEDLGKG